MLNGAATQHGHRAPERVLLSRRVPGLAANQQDQLTEVSREEGGKGIGRRGPSWTLLQPPYHSSRSPPTSRPHTLKEIPCSASPSAACFWVPQPCSSSRRRHRPRSLLVPTWASTARTCGAASLSAASPLPSPISGFPCRWEPAAAITVGGWGNIELGKYDGADEISEGGGEGGPDLTEFNWWAEYAHSFGQAEFTLGSTGYIYPNDAGITSDANTIEIYGRLGFANVLSPRISAYYDMDKIKGLYLEGSLGYDVPVSESFSVSLGALAGLSAGQGINEDDPSESANFAENGLTHVDLSASTEFAAGPFAISPAFHFQISNDEFTKFNKPSKPDESVKIWFGVTFSWASGGRRGGSRVDRISDFRLQDFRLRLKYCRM